MKNRNILRERRNQLKGTAAWILGLILLWSAASQAVPSQLKATVIDRSGNSHAVEKLTFRGRLEIEYYVADQRRLAPLQEIDRMLFEGAQNREEQTITVTLRTGRQETGKILTGTGSAPPQGALGGTEGTSGFSGSTALGPFDIQLGNVREVVMRHPEGLEPAREAALRATLMGVDGKLFEIRELRFRGKQRMDYKVGDKQRFVDLEKVSRIEFAEGGLNKEQRQVTITYWSGKTAQGTVDMSVVRMSGETDKSYRERVNAAITGKTDTGTFAIGLHQLKQIRFHPADEDEEQEDQPADGKL